MNGSIAVAAPPFAAEHIVSFAVSGARSVASTDVDGDGDADLLSASALGDKIAWHENTLGDGSIWNSHTVTTEADFAVSVAWADVDGDGDPDLLSASTYDDKIAWYENTAGDGSAWTVHTVTTTADGARSVAWADVDGDGDADLLSASTYDDKLAWYENTVGNGSAWTSRTVTVAADGAWSVAWADVDGDGDADLLSASAYDDKIAWYENTAGNGSIWATHTVTTAADGASSVSWADVDGDGDVDLLSASRGDDKLAWYENTAGDGSVWTTHTVTTAALSAASVSSTDVDGDGNIDLLSASYDNGRLAWYQNTASDGTTWTTHSFTDWWDVSNSVAWADVDGDGDADLLSASHGEHKVTWYENRTIHRSTLFSSHTTISSTADWAGAVSAVDVDGDGDTDLLSASQGDNKIAWYRNQYSGALWTTHTVTDSAIEALSVAWVDMDSDGDIDLISASAVDDKIAWYENTAGDGSVWNVQTVTVDASGACSVATADIDGDGDPDLLSASFWDNKLAWYENTAGNGSAWTTHTVSTALNRTCSASWADVDGDGDTDLLSVSRNEGKVVWFENTAGDGSIWGAHTVTTKADYAVSVTSADVDGDGDVDLLSASSADDKIAWYENTARDGSAWTTHTVTTAADGAWSVAWIDADGDGDVDFLSASINDDKIAWYENTAGDGSDWATHTVTATADGARSVAWADLDNDGDPDLASASRDDDRIAWYENRGGQFALDAFNVGPAILSPPNPEPILDISLVHLGRSGDLDAELVELRLKFEETAGDVLTSAEANNLIAELRIYSDDGSRGFDLGIDTLVKTVDQLTLTDGIQTVVFPDGDPALQASFDAPRTFFVIPELTDNAFFQTPGRFRVTLPGSPSGVAENRDDDFRLIQEHGDEVSSTVATATCAGHQIEIPNYTFWLVYENCTGTTSIRTTGTAVEIVDSDVTFTAPTIGLNGGFRVQAGSFFTAGPP